mmetsp:Transcript_2779/g.5222  ORF Transcript_2779/g.5222 Transcript_2779/m.5222 type:complete len:195 (+) Transcript_2779:417-1001(+)
MHSSVSRWSGRSSPKAPSAFFLGTSDCTSVRNPPNLRWAGSRCFVRRSPLPVPLRHRENHLDIILVCGASHVEEEVLKGQANLLENISLSTSFPEPDLLKGLNERDALFKFLSRALRGTIVKLHELWNEDTKRSNEREGLTGLARLWSLARTRATLGKLWDISVDRSVECDRYATFFRWKVLFNLRETCKAADF